MEKKKILIVDDEEDFIKLVKLNLEATGKYEVRTENKGLSALAVTKEFKPDLIFMDIMMPDMGGDQVVEQMKKDVDIKDIPVVFLTAVADKEKVVSWGQYYLPGYPIVAKPITAKEVIDAIEANIRK